MLETTQTFLSIQAQDFIEEAEGIDESAKKVTKFLSIQAQDFIEDGFTEPPAGRVQHS